MPRYQCVVKGVLQETAGQRLADDAGPQTRHGGAPDSPRPPMTLPVIAAVLVAALLHAAWHALVKASGERVAALAGMNLVSGAVALCFLPFVAVPRPHVLAIVAFSVLLHVGYKIALAQLYRRADLGQAYPLARGLTPAMATLLALAFLDERPGAGVLAGMALISLGVLVLARERADRPVDAATLGIAALTGFAVAAYSAVDAWGVRLSGDWLGFTAWLVACDTATFLAYAFATRGRAVLAAWRAGAGRVIVSGLLGVLSFGTFLWALAQAPVGGVAALRETSVIFAALIGTLALGERASWRRHAAAFLVMAGAAVMALGRRTL
jgi:drug/metabolite transporter (DMT)-like permease